MGGKVLEKGLDALGRNTRLTGQETSSVRSCLR